ncbi:hypothetical protein K504DRAFT_455507 [Pleomassaria siparia CBS 279.74]|uniref:DUF8004 domain-containing protein n=1 Tax=Pleomassaria siparia CBS 279.74 TaxID=1314801 RepID=A0A6G1KBW1_9PLEO|nr:hypothetical protein K504DRAFT_455507 [Pleomassaria siparia CBS 279.74]
MSGRGARSRKAIVKDIEKKEKKDTGKNKAIESVRRPHDAFDAWASSPSLGTRDTTGTGIPSRSVTISSDGSRLSPVSRSSSINDNGSRPRLNTISSMDSLDLRGLHRPKTSASGGTSTSDVSNGAKEKIKYQAKGKETKAPRGRGGGVPVKKPNPASSSLPPPLFRFETSAPHAPSLNGKSWINFKIWQGGEAGLKPYSGFDCDEHMHTGNVLIYFKEEQQSDDRPTPQIRAHLDVLENSGSTWLSNALMYGSIDNEDEWSLPGCPESSNSRQPYPPSNHGPEPRIMLGPTSSGGISPPPFNMDQAYFRPPGNGTASMTQHYPGSDRSGNTQAPPSFHQIPTHEIWFTAPAHIKSPQAQRLHHVAIRNFLALLHNKPIVGSDIFEMLTTLQPEIEIMYDLDHDNQSRLTPRERSVQMITNYLSQHKLDDVRNNVKLALGLLAWAEQDNVKWRQGYLESFAHLAGIMSPQIEELPDFKRLSIGTRRNLGISAKTLQLRVMETEEKLGAFDFSDLWENAIKAAGGAVNQSYQAFRQFLISYYTKIYGNWPPIQGKTWLNRRIALGLQEDFGALYDYLVDRDAVWDSREERPGKKWEMANKKVEDFRADLPDLSITDMLVTFDNRHGYLHIPYPYPLLPREVPGVKKTVQKKSLFGGLKKSKADTTQDAKAHLQLSIVFSDATNINKPDFSINGSTFIDAFERFELTTDLKSLTPREARLGRWVLLYGTLQVISTLAVDNDDLKWTNGVRYFLCSDLKRCPEWVTHNSPRHTEAIQLRSWCWQRSWAPTQHSNAPIELDASSVPADGELEGGTLLNEDMDYICEKIDAMSIGTARTHIQSHTYEWRLENEKVKQEDLGKMKRMDDSDRLTEKDLGREQWEREREVNDMQRDAHREQERRIPLIPPKNHLRGPSTMGAHEFPMPPQGFRNGHGGGWAS